MVARATQDSIDLGWSDPPLADTGQGAEQPAVPLDTLDDDEPTRVATSAAAIVVPAAAAVAEAAPALSADAAIEMAPTLPAGSAALEMLAHVTEPLEVPAVDSDAIDASDIHEEGARVTEPGLAPPPPTSSELAAAEAVAAIEAPVAAAEAPVAAAEAPVAAAEAPVAAVHETPVAETKTARIEASHPATIPSPSAAMAPVSIPPPPIAPAFFTPSSFAPTAADWNELGSPSLLATMKRTRPTSAWTGVGLFVAALTFAGGIGIGRSMTPPALPPVAVPAPLQTSVAAGSLAATSMPAATTPPPAAPVAPSKPAAPFDAKAARAALDDAANAAKTCRATGDPKGTVPTTVTFGSSGMVSSVAINSSRYAGTKTARCIAERLTQARVPEFSGFPEAVKKLVTVR